jgi:hypothetical protein
MTPLCLKQVIQSLKSFTVYACVFPFIEIKPEYVFTCILKVAFVLSISLVLGCFVSMLNENSLILDTLDFLVIKLVKSNWLSLLVVIIV